MKRIICSLAMIMSFACFADATIPLKGDILSVSDKEVIVVTQTHRLVLDNQKLKIQTGSENCHRQFNLLPESIMESKKLSRKPTVVCTNKLTTKMGVSR